MKKYYILFTLLMFFNITLLSKEDESWKVYDDTQVAVINITMNPADLNFMYANPRLDIVHYCSVHFKNAFVDQVIDSVGIRLRGNTSRDSQKKSFKLSLNEFIKDQDLLGIEKLNLNGEHNDPSIMRSKASWDLANKIGMLSSRAAHTLVYINGKYYGLYVSVENIDDDFLKKRFADASGNLWKCLYPADLAYEGESPSQYSKRTYELATNAEADDYSQLIRITRILNTTPQAALQDSIESVLSVSSVLKYLAFNLLVGSWDDYRYNQNNYYLYHEPSKDIFHLIPYDYDNTFGISWSSSDWTSTKPYTISSGRPLVYKLLSDPQYRNLYTHFLEFYNTNVYTLDSLKNNLDRIRFLITGWASADTFRTLDYGFTFADFLNSFNETPYNKFHVRRALKEFIQQRHSTLPSQLNYMSNVKPIVYDIRYNPENPGPSDSIYVTASAFSKAGMKSLNLNLKLNESLHNIPLKYSPVANTKRVEEADRWTGIIPPLQNVQYASLSVTAEDIYSLSQKYPRTKDIILKSPVQAGDIVINEFLASNISINTDEKDQYEDWIELYNKSAQTVDLSGKYITDNPVNLNKWEIPSGTLLEAGKHLLIWCDEDSSQGLYHSNFKLSIDGEFLALVDTDGSTILDSLTFGAQTTDVSYGRFPDGSTNWQTLFPTPAAGNSVTSVDEDNSIPQEFTISAFPNPFNPNVNIRYTLPFASEVTIKIFDLLGKELYAYRENFMTAGNHIFNWNAANFSTGTYICTIQANKVNKTIKLLLLK